MSRSQPVALPPLRLTVPLFGTSFTGGPAGKLVDGRIEITSGVTVARLDQAESERIRVALAGMEHPAVFRLEIATSTLAGRSLTDAQAETVISRTLALLSCAVRFAPRWRAAVIDRYDGDHWARVRFLHVTGGGSPRPSYIPLERARTWGVLLDHWPLLGLDPPADAALDLYRESVAERQVRPAKSFLSAMAAVEALVGEPGRGDGELAYQRACTLVLAGWYTPALTERLRSWRTVRADYLHRGLVPTFASLVGIHRFLMRALPATAALLEAVGGDHNHVLAWLDAVKDRPPETHPLARDDQWWAYVGLESIVAEG